MIDSLLIENFQSHKHTELGFSPGVNVIVGSSDCGKSAVLRALNWIVNNHPSGDGFVSWWDKKTKCKVTLKVDGNEISRIRGKGQGPNKYFLGDEKLTGFGQGVPEEITEVINLNEMNIQRQHASPYLLDDTPGEVGRKLNKVVNLDIIDEVFKKVRSRYMEVNQVVTLENERLGKLREDYAGYNYLDQLESDLGLAEKLDKEINDIGDDYAVLNNLIVDLEEQTGELFEINKVLAFDNKVESLINEQEGLEDSEHQKEELKILIQDILEDAQNLTVCNDMVTYEKEVCDSIAQVTALVDDSYNLKVLKEIVVEHYSLLFDLGETENKLVVLETDFHSRMPDICPLCEQEIEVD